MAARWHATTGTFSALNSGSTALLPKNKMMNTQKTSGKTPENTWSMHQACLWKIFCYWVHGYAWFGKSTMKEKFCVFSQNVRSLRKNVHLLVENLSGSKLWSVVALSETWQSDDTLYVKISGYQGFLASNHKTKASEVPLFVDQKIQVQVKDLNNFCFNTLVVDIFLRSSPKFLVIVISNSPSNSSETSFARFWNNVGSKSGLASMRGLRWHEYRFNQTKRNFKNKNFSEYVFIIWFQANGYSTYKSNCSQRVMLWSRAHQWSQ